MSIISLDNNNSMLIYSENFIYSKVNSRPSKSIVDPELYTKYKQIKENFNVFDNVKDLVFKECISYVYSSYNKVSNSIYLIDKITYKLIEFYNYKFNNITNSLNDKYTNYIIITNDINSYPKMQYIYMLSKFFENIKIVMSQISDKNIICCSNRLSKIYFNIDNSFIKDFNIKVEDIIIKYIKKNNSILHKYFIDINESINNQCNNLSQISIINKEIEVVNKYYKSYINKSNDVICNCRVESIIYSNILNCHICENCLVLTHLFFAL